MRKFLSYLHDRRLPLLLYAATCAVFAAVCALTGLNWQIVCYALLLTGFFLLLFLLIDGARYFRLLRALAHFDEVTALLPAPRDAVEAAYQRLLREQTGNFRRYRGEQAASRADALDYYTLWVHQIKTPIAALRLLLDNGTQNAAERELFKIEQYADLALRYVKLEDISSDLLVAACKLSPIVHACIKKFSLLFISQKLSVRIDPLPESVVSDARWLAFILEQVIGNSIKYTRSGGVHIYFKNGALAIADTGIGIRAEDLPRIFEKGFTGCNGRLDARASGIGLYLAKKAADALSIELSARSKVGAGTLISLTFPAQDTFARV